MARFQVSKTNFTAGELSPKLYGRTDIQRYGDAAKEILNAIPLPYGGVTRRDGTVYVASSKDSTKSCRLIPYVFNRDQAYVLEFGDYYMRVYKDNGQVTDQYGGPYEIATPYAEADVMDINFAQSGDAMFLAHRSYYPQRLRRFDHDEWIMTESPFISVPTDETGIIPETNAALSATSEGIGRTITAESAVFVYADATRYISGTNGGLAQITSVSSPLVATIKIIKDFPSSSILAGEWKIEGTPFIAITPSAASPVGGSITITAGGTYSVGSYVSLFSIINDRYVYDDFGNYFNKTRFTTTSAHGFSVGNTIVLQGSVFSGAFPDQYNKTYTVEKVISSTSFWVSPVIFPDFLSDFSALGSVAKVTSTLATDVFRPSDVGARIMVNGGSAVITAVTSPLLVSATIEANMSSAISAIAGSWSIEYPVWRSDDYPGAVGIYEQRLMFAGSPTYPNAVWMSAIGEYLNFTGGSQDSDGVGISVSSDIVADIRHLSQAKSLIALSSGGEFTFYGGVEKPITPTNVQVKNPTPYGCNGVRPQRIGNEVYFAQRSGKKIRAMAYKFDSDSFGSPDMTELADHITGDGIVDMAYQAETNSILWCVRSDGKLASCTVNRDQNVIAWALHDVGGSVESICSIPVSDGDQVWIVVNRTIDGSTVRYIERMDDVGMDAAIIGTEEVATDTWGNLSHLEGETVSVKADDVVIADQTVSGGQVVLPREANSVVIGLPYTSRIVTLTPELMTGQGSSQGASMSISEVSVRFLDTINCKMDGDVIAFNHTELNTAPTPYTGTHKIGRTGWGDGELEITFEQDMAYPWHILSISYTFTVN